MATCVKLHRDSAMPTPFFQIIQYFIDHQNLLCIQIFKEVYLWIIFKVYSSSVIISYMTQNNRSLLVYQIPLSGQNYELKLGSI